MDGSWSNVKEQQPPMPPPVNNLKRPRQSNPPATTTGGFTPAGTTSSAAAAPSAAPRPKRRKPAVTAATVADDSSVDDNRKSGGAGAKGKDEEGGGDEKDIVIKLDFNDLPDETLYRYLEMHDLLPRWHTSPWSEEPCTTPNTLYSLPPAATNETAPARSASPAASNSTALPPDTTALQTEGADPEAGENGDETPAPPTTRSKTAPLRKIPTPTPPPSNLQQRGVITLSDVHYAREVLAEKANSHWIKGLGGGQNKEGETIVNFLYKMKVGPGRLLRVYNPSSSAAI